MQSTLRAINIILSPVLTLFFASRLEGLTIAGRDADELIAASAAGLLVLAIEVALAQGPRHSLWLRRWLDPRAAFEGIWLQDVFAGQSGNAVGMFSLDYEPDADAFAVLGYAYSANGRRWAKWKSTHMFIEKARLNATYLWEGELLAGETPDAEKAGLTELELRRPPSFSLAVFGEGRVLHVGEGTRVEFSLRRVTGRLLRDMNLRFTIRELRINAYDEQGKLVQAFLRHRRQSAEQLTTA